MTPPNTIKLSTTAVFSIAVVMLGYHLSAIFDFSLPLDLAGPQGSFEDSVISIVVNVLLLLTVGLRVSATMALSYQRALNVFMVIFILLFTLMTLQSLQSGAWFLLAAALVNLAALFRLLFYKRIPSENLGILSMQTDSNADQAIEFLAENAEKTDVITTDSGLQYRIITAGSGDLPTTDSVVEVHYVGRLLDGSQFDSSIDRGVPTQFGVTQVISGWSEALQLMAEGSKWELFIPPDLAYGSWGQGPIGPDAVLIFEVELLQANVA